MMSCKHLDLNHRPSTPPMEDLKAGSNGKSQVWLKPESDITLPWSCRPWTHHQRQAVLLVEVMSSEVGLPRLSCSLLFLQDLQSTWVTVSTPQILHRMTDGYWRLGSLGHGLHKEFRGAWLPCARMVLVSVLSLPRMS